MAGTRAKLVLAFIGVAAATGVNNPSRLLTLGGC